MHLSSRYKRWFIHIFLVITSFLVASFFYGDANKFSRWLIDNGVLLISGKPLSYTIKADEDGIPYVLDNSVGRQRNPVTVCNSAISYLEKVNEGDVVHRKYFLNCANWILTHRTFRNDTTSLLQYGYDWAIYKMKAPWQSGMAQGLSLQVLINAHRLTKDEKYLKAANEQLNSFFLSVAENGVTYKSPTEGWWYEEFADSTGTTSRVLNGMMFATLGIHDYFEYTKSEKAKYLFEQGVLAVKTHVAEYDKNGFSYYDKLGTTNLKYHWIHVDLLQKMFNYTGEPVFQTYAEKWSEYKDPNMLMRMIKNETKPIYYAMYLVNAALLFLLLELLFLLSRLFKSKS
jgi:heparosan-N-sulfate-glucuronate 5-epimerase